MSGLDERALTLLKAVREQSDELTAAIGSPAPLRILVVQWLGAVDATADVLLRMVSPPYASQFRENGPDQ